MQPLNQSYLDFLEEYIATSTLIYAYPDETGIPGYPVYRDFRFVILSSTADTLFVYGSSSD